MDNIFYLFGRSSPNKIAREKNVEFDHKKTNKPPTIFDAVGAEWKRLNLKDNEKMAFGVVF